MRYLLEFIVVAIAALIGSWVSSFFRKKGENLATKQDIAGITKEMESVKAVIGTKQYIHQIRYQNEYHIFEELMEKLVEVREIAETLRPVLDSWDPKKSESERKSERLEPYRKALRNLYIYFENKKPFIPENIYDGAKELIEIASKEGATYAHLSPENMGGRIKYYEDAEKNVQTISGLADSVIQLIRNRIKYWEGFESESVDETRMNEGK